MNAILKTSILLIILSLCSAIFILTNTRIDNYKNKEDVLSNTTKTNFKILQKTLKQMIIFENSNIDTIWIFQDNKKNILNKYLDTNHILILFYPQHYCGECFHGDLIRFKDIEEKYKNKTLIISTDLNKRDLFFWKKKHDIKSDSYQIHIGNNVLFHEIKEPCFFLLNKELKIHLFFNPDPDLPELSDFYFEKIDHILNTQKNN